MNYDPAQRHRVVHSFSAFAREAWKIVDSAPLQWGWFLELLCDELQRWAERKEGYRNLLLAVPPGMGKSLYASVLMPAWQWLREPSTQYLCCTHGQQLAIRDNVKMRDLVRSQWYQELVCGQWELKADQDQKMHYENTCRGLRQAIGGNSGLTGWRGDDIIIDDPLDLNPRKPPRQEDRDTAFAWVQYIRGNRINDPRRSRTLLISQRSFEDDPAGRLLEAEPDSWRAVCFDMVRDSALTLRHPDDPRADGELLFPERIGPIEVEHRRSRLGPEQFQAQDQQQPSIASGNIVREDDIIIVESAANEYQYKVMSWDLAFKGDATSSYVVGTVWGVNHPTSIDNREFTLLDVWRDQVDYLGSKAAVESLFMRHPDTGAVLVEDKANGPALISELSYKMPNIVPFNPAPYGDKAQRLRAITPVFAQRRIRIVRADWNKQYIEEIVRAPKYPTWDQVDSTTQAVLCCIYESNKLQAATAPRRVRILGGW